LVVNLAAADLIIGFITEPLYVHYHIKEGLQISNVAEELITIHMVYFISCTASVLSQLQVWQLKDIFMCENRIPIALK
jgi:hypothetical protein